MGLEQSEKIQLKLTYNTNKNMPRTFFAHLYHVPLDTVVNITQAERELPTTRNGDYVESRTWIVPDVEVLIKVSRGESVVASAVYILHNGKFFAPAFGANDIDLLQITYMYM